MKTINSKNLSETIINKSRFIALAYPLDSKDKITDILNNVKNDYPKATHYCYAYKIPPFMKVLDDGEPGGTAGMPILNVIEKNDLTNILIIVVRFFGGVKLGAGGLVRAYSKSAAKVIEEGNIKQLHQGILCDITFNFKDIGRIDYILKDSLITNKDFSNTVTYRAKLKNDEELITRLENIADINTIKKILL